MKNFQYKIQDPLGLHVRPAGMLVKKAKEYESIITIVKGNKKAFADKLMDVMALGIKKGEDITVNVEGEDEDLAFLEMERFFKDNF